MHEMEIYSDAMSMTIVHQAFRLPCFYKVHTPTLVCIHHRIFHTWPTFTMKVKRSKLTSEPLETASSPGLG